MVESSNPINILPDLTTDPNNDKLQYVPITSNLSTSPIYGIHLSSLGNKKSLSTRILQLIDILPSYQMHQSILNRAQGKDQYADNTEVPDYSIINPEEDMPSIDDPVVADDSSKDSILDNIYLLPTVRDKDTIIRIKINNPIPNICNSGDTMSGMVEIENTSNGVIPFELFFTSFEGTSRVSSKRNATYGDEYKVRNFLRMVDLGGSWTESDREVRLSDRLYMNLPHNRQLLPRTTYQKFFRFTIPQDALDINCIHNILQHSHLPPSIGMNTILIPPKGYEVDDEEKSRFKLRDMSTMDFSINYSIEARLIRKSELSGKYILSSMGRFLMRVIPTSKGPQQYVLSPDKSLDLLERIVNNDIENALGNRENDEMQLKLRNLYHSRRNCSHGLAYYLTGKFSNCFKLVMNDKKFWNCMTESIDEKKFKEQEGDARNLTFSTNSAINLDFNRLSNPTAKNTRYDVRFNVDLFYQLMQQDLQIPQQSYISIDKLDSIVPTEVSADLYYVNVHAKGLPIPIELNPLWFTSEYIFRQKVMKKFEEFNDEVGELPEDAQLYSTTLQLLRAMKNLNCDVEVIPNVVSVRLIGKTTTVIVENEFLEESYKTSLQMDLSIDNKNLKSCLLVPDYQDCLSSRLYFVRLKFKGTKFLNSNFKVHYNAVNGDLMDKLSDKQYKFYLDVPVKIEKL